MEAFLLVSVEGLLLALCGWRLRLALRTHRAWATFGVWIDRVRRPRLYWALVGGDLTLIAVLTGLVVYSLRDWLALK